VIPLSDFDHYLQTARRIAWVPALLAVCTVPFALNTGPVQLVAVAACALGGWLMNRSRFTFRLFVGAGYMSMCGLLLSFTAALRVIVPSDILQPLFDFLEPMAAGMLLLIALTTAGFARLWSLRFAVLRSADSSEARPKHQIWSLLLHNQSGVSFWRSPEALALMTSMAVLGSWISYEFGVQARSLLLLAIVAISWSLTLGSALGLAVALLRFPHVSRVSFR
jgi:hypothetical protein